MVWHHIISRLWAESTPTVTGMDPTLPANVPLAHFLINHIVYLSYTPSMTKSLARHLALLNSKIDRPNLASKVQEGPFRAWALQRGLDKLMFSSIR